MPRDLSTLSVDPLGVERVQLERLARTALQLVVELPPSARRELAHLDESSSSPLEVVSELAPLVSASRSRSRSSLASRALEPVMRALEALVTRALASVARALDVKATSPVTSSRPGESVGSAIARVAAELVPRFASRVARVSESAPDPLHAPPRSPTLLSPTPTPPTPSSTWLGHAAATLATQAHSEAVVRLAPLVARSVAQDPAFPTLTPADLDPADPGSSLRKLWMANNDLRTRPEHRRLAGTSRPLGAPFWRSLDPDHPGTLSYPGDPSAPLSQTVNCRCWLWLVPASEASQAKELFAYDPPPAPPAPPAPLPTAAAAVPTPRPAPALALPPPPPRERGPA